MCTWSTLVIPELATKRWWRGLRRDQSGLLLKFAFLFEPKVVLASVNP